MRMFVHSMLAALLILAATSAKPALAGPKVGDAAPELKVSAVINGDIADFADLKGKVVFVEFWATW